MLLCIAGFVPDILDTGLLDEVIPVHSKVAITTAQKLAKQEGILVGISSGAAAYAAAQVGLVCVCVCQLGVSLPAVARGTAG